MRSKKSIMQKTKLGQGLIKGLKEAVLFEQNKINLKSTAIEIPDSPPDFTKSEVKEVREFLNVSQSLFAKILGVSGHTVKSWELGSNKPSGSSARLIQMAKQNPNTFKELIQSLI